VTRCLERDQQAAEDDGQQQVGEADHDADEQRQLGGEDRGQVGEHGGQARTSTVRPDPAKVCGMTWSQVRDEVGGGGMVGGRGREDVLEGGRGIAAAHLDGRR
jgi:hypothetical protein